MFLLLFLTEFFQILIETVYPVVSVTFVVIFIQIENEIAVV